MRRDSIFYRLFKQSPILLFELLPVPPVDAERYRFDSVAVKEPKFEIDGVFLPPDALGVVYFCEVQFQKDELLYERLFGESMLYFYRNRHRFSDWQAVVIYPSRNIEQSDTHPYRILLNSDQMHRIYLNELGEFQQLPLGVASMVLTTLDESQAPEAARNLLERSRRADLAVEASRAIIDMVTTIMVYKFTNLSRREVEAMLNLRLEEARAFQEIKEEGREEGRQQEAARFVLRLLTRRFNQTLSEAWQQRISVLSIEQLERLGEALLDFSAIDDLEVWLRTNLQ